MKTRSQNNERKWKQHLHKIANKENQQEQIQQPFSNQEESEVQKYDAIKFPDDTTLKVHQASHIYHKLISFKDATRKYRPPKMEQ